MTKYYVPFKIRTLYIVERTRTTQKKYCLAKVFPSVHEVTKVKKVDSIILPPLGRGGRLTRSVPGYIRK